MKKIISFILLITLLLPSLSIAKGKGFTIIRDDEIETVIKNISQDIFKTAGLNPDHINIKIIKDDSLNAFVAGGQNIFINSGTIIKAKTANELIGVIAHETGHIVGGHLSRSSTKIKDLQENSLISTIVGGGAAILSGRADVGAAVSMTATSANIEQYLRYRRSEERAADDAAIEILNNMGISPIGFLTFMKRIRSKEAIYIDSKKQNPYLRTHPLSRERITFINHQYSISDYKYQINSKYDEEFNRAKAKLFAFLKTPTQTRIKYNMGDDSIAGKYARILADFKDLKIKKSLKNINKLIETEPGNPYFYELKGQMLFEFGKLEKAMVQYQNATNLLSGNELINLELVKVKIEIGKTKELEHSIEILKELINNNYDNPKIYQYMSLIHGKLGKMIDSNYWNAEYYMELGNHKKALKHAKKAEQSMSEHHKLWIKTQDIIKAINNYEHKHK